MLIDMDKKDKQKEALLEVAGKYYELSVMMKQLEAEIAPLKRVLADYARETCLPTVEVGNVVVDRKMRTTAKMDRSAVTPDWLWRWQQAGLNDALKLGIDPSRLPEDGSARDLLGEIGYEETQSRTYAVRLKPSLSHEPA